MNTLFEKMETMLALTSDKIVRDDINQIRWDKRLNSILGPRGVGKTTLLLQHIKREYGAGTRKALDCSLDWVYFSTHSILDLAAAFRMHGGA